MVMMMPLLMTMMVVKIIISSGNDNELTEAMAVRGQLMAPNGQ